jgi:hypothetical protein
MGLQNGVAYTLTFIMVSFFVRMVDLHQRRAAVKTPRARTVLQAQITATALR